MATRAKRIDPVLLRVRVHLIDSEPEIWRLIEIDGDLPLTRVHTALQIAMGWQDYHLHEFLDFDPLFPSGAPPVSHRRWTSDALEEDGQDDDSLPEKDFTLRDVLTEQSPLFYLYDFGDDWLHRMDLIETLGSEPGEPRAAVIRGERRCPLEDSGGVEGYEHVLLAIGDPDDEEHDELREWVDSMHHDQSRPFDAAAFDVQATNRKLRRAFP